MKKTFSANRVVLALHSVFVIATAASIFAVTLSGSLPKAWQPDVAFAVTLATGIAGATIAVTKFLDGSQKNDANTTQYALKQIELEQEKMYHERAMAEHRLDADDAVKADFTKSVSDSGTNLPPTATSSATEVTTSELWWENHPDFIDSQSADVDVDIPSDSSAITPDDSVSDSPINTAELQELASPENLDPQLWLKTRRDLAEQTESAQTQTDAPLNTTGDAS